jgi:hypothetical protein
MSGWHDQERRIDEASRPMSSLLFVIPSLRGEGFQPSVRGHLIELADPDSAHGLAPTPDKFQEGRVRLHVGVNAEDRWQFRASVRTSRAALQPTAPQNELRSEDRADHWGAIHHHVSHLDPGIRSLSTGSRRSRPVILDEADVLRDEGETYAARLRAAGVPVTSVATHHARTR